MRSKNSEIDVTKQGDRTDRMEEDLEVIYELIKQKEYATRVDISNNLKVISPSVIKMI